MKTRLRYWRFQRALTIKELSVKAGMNSTAPIVNMEKHGKFGHPETRRKLAAALEISPSELLTTDNDPEADGLKEPSASAA